MMTTAAVSTERSLLVRMRGIGKRFGPVTVLQGVDLDIRGGEVLILAGENGAGKSTLIKILGGVYPDFEGSIEIGGVQVRPGSPLEANELGVAVIYQELSLVAAMSVADNIFLGRPLAKAGFVSDREQQRQAAELVGTLGIEVDVTRRVEELPIAQQQMVEIAKALARRAKVLVMDEPTSALSAPEVSRLFSLIADLKARGCGIVYITHKMEEIQRVADRIAVLRDGRNVGEAPAADLPPTKLVEWMVGREIGEQFPRIQHEPGPVRLALEHFSVEHPSQPGRLAVDDVTLQVRSGEVLGLGGLQGSGASELFWGLFGAYGRRVRGQAQVNGTPFQVKSPAKSIQQGVALLTNDRKASGLVLPLSIVANTTLAALRELSSGGWRRPGLEDQVAREHATRLNLKAASLDQDVGVLSGGNQQKVVLAKWLQTAPKVLLLDEPTRGIDVGAKREIYELLNQLTGQGLAIVMITSELPELLALSDRVLVMHRGRVSAEFARGVATPEKVLEAAMGGHGSHAADEGA